MTQAEDSNDYKLSEGSQSSRSSQCRGVKLRYFNVSSVAST